MRRFDGALSKLEEYDDGLRSRLFQKNDTSRLAESLRVAKPRIIYMIEDLYGCRYCFFRPPEFCGEDSSYCIIGPWLETSPDEAGIDAIILQGRIPNHLRSELVQYFNWVPQISAPRSWEALLLAFAGYFYGGGGEQTSISYKGIDLGSPIDGYSPEPEAILSMRIIEERYQNENAMLMAVSEGNSGQALQCMTQFRGYQGYRRSSDQLRDRKNYCIILNSLARKAVENGYVHPAHIDAVSAEFAHRIEAAGSIGDLAHLSEIMVRRYCDLVNEFSLKGYSPLIRKAINTVDFNLQKPLALSIIAKECNANASYLSAQFKREKGMTVTDYINQKRLEHAVQLLSRPGVYIQQAAEKSGFLDVNYFSRIFKRRYGITPREFREIAYHGN